MRALAQSSPTVRKRLEQLRLRSDAARASLARIDERAGTFTILAQSGKDLIGLGSSYPTRLSTQVDLGSRGTFACEAFERDTRWLMPLDQVMLELGFRAGCSVGLDLDDVGPAVVSLSFVRQLSGDGAGLLSATSALGGHIREAWLAPPIVLAIEPILGETLARLVRGEFLRQTVSVPGIAALLRLLEVQDVSLVLVDLPDSSEGELALGRVRASTAAPLVAICARDDDYHRRRSRDLGLSGYLPLGAPLDDVVDVLAGVLGGATILPRLAWELPTPLAPREHDVLVLLAAGHTFLGCAARLGLAEATVKAYARSLYTKLGVHSRGEAVARARDHGLLP